jgi:hypothetical protein
MLCFLCQGVTPPTLKASPDCQVRVWNALVIVLLLLLALVLPTAIHGTDHVMQVYEELWEGAVDWVRDQWWWPRSGRFGDRDGGEEGAEEEEARDIFSPSGGERVRVCDEMESTLEQLHSKARLTSPSTDTKEHKARAWAEGAWHVLFTFPLYTPCIILGAVCMCRTRAAMRRTREGPC